MAANTGRTTSKWITFNVDDSAGTLRAIPINSISVVGVVYDEQDVTAFQDAVKNALPNMPDAPIEISGPFDNTAAAAAPALSGSHTVLSGINGVSTTPLALGVKFGIRHDWESGEPVFGITGSPANGYLCVSYTVNPNDMTYTAKFVCYPGSAIPAWGTTAIT